MDDVQQIDLVEKIKSYVQQTRPGPEYGAAASESSREKDPLYFRQKFLAILFDVDDAGPAGRRQLRQLARLIELEPREVLEPETVAEEPEPYDFDPRRNPWKAHPAWKRRDRVTRILEQLRGEDDPATPALIQRLRAAHHLREAVDAARKALGLLHGLKLYRFLEAAGRPLILPDAPRRMLLYRLGLTTSMERGDAWPGQFFSAGETLAHLTGESLTTLNRWFGLYTGATRDTGRIIPVCVKRPKCHICVAGNYCAWRRFKQPEPERPASARRIKQMAESERPRERLQNLGPGKLSDAELLAILLRTGAGEFSALELARLLLERFGRLRRLDRASIAEMSQVHGIGPAKATEIRAALELGRRMFAETDDEADDDQLLVPEKIFERYRARLSNCDHEEFHLILLNTKNRVIRDVLISRGDLQSTVVHPREAFKEAIRESAASVIFVHNHPSGDPTPSPEDLDLTQRLVSAGRILGIRVLDHIIIGRHDFQSLQRCGLI